MELAWREEGVDFRIEVREYSGNGFVGVAIVAFVRGSRISLMEKKVVPEHEKDMWRMILGDLATAGAVHIYETSVRIARNQKAGWPPSHSTNALFPLTPTEAYKANEDGK